ncbi:transcription initiation factor TFIID subunit 10-like [Halichondria panicea]|uniref:transcription initiation factor TFIID subunit 10-like n=1 Tax=Halichondria panicea TaxID=6063 RepID=UPI00312B6366
MASDAPSHVLSSSDNPVAVEDIKNEPEIPDVSLLDFCAQLEDYTPTVPDAVTVHFLQKAGFSTRDPKIVRLVSLAAQKFISDIANDALQHCKMRSAGQSARKATKDRKYTLTMEDLGKALGEYGINLKKPAYYT